MVLGGDDGGKVYLFDMLSGRFCIELLVFSITVPIYIGNIETIIEQRPRMDVKQKQHIRIGVKQKKAMAHWKSSCFILNNCRYWDREDLNREKNGTWHVKAMNNTNDSFIIAEHVSQPNRNGIGSMYDFRIKHIFSRISYFPSPIKINSSYVIWVKSNGFNCVVKDSVWIFKR